MITYTKQPSKITSWFSVYCAPTCTHTHTVVHCSLHIGGLIGVGPIGHPGEPGLRGPSGSRGSKGDPGDPGIVLSACSTETTVYKQ